jgi:hypothetical protein
MAVPCFYWAFQVCGDSDQIHVDLSYAAFRWAVAQTSATAMISAERASETVSTPCFVAHVLLHRNAGSLSWRREVSSKGKGYRFLLRTLPVVLRSPVLYDINPCVVHSKV